MKKLHQQVIDLNKSNLKLKEQASKLNITPRRLYNIRHELMKAGKIPQSSLSKKLMKHATPVPKRSYTRKSVANVQEKVTESLGFSIVLPGGTTLTIEKNTINNLVICPNNTIKILG